MDQPEHAPKGVVELMAAEAEELAEEVVLEGIAEGLGAALVRLFETL
jgi:hypothetical protein